MRNIFQFFWRMLTFMAFRPLAHMYFFFTGWTLVGRSPGVMKMVIVVAPHRQGLGDLLRGLATKTLITFPDNLRFLAKKELFRNPLQRMFLKWLGAIPVDRDHSEPGSVKGYSVSELVTLFNVPECALVITPEGTRKDVPWKNGFYRIALEAQIPIVFVVFDYIGKRVVIVEPAYMTGRQKEDKKTIREPYRENTSGYEPKLRDDLLS